MTKATTCPWCGSALSKFIDAEKGHIEWACGSFKRGPEPYQADSCRILQLEIQREKLQARTDVLGDADTTIANLKAENHRLTMMIRYALDGPDDAQSLKVILTDALDGMIPKKNFEQVRGERKWFKFENEQLKADYERAQAGIERLKAVLKDVAKAPYSGAGSLLETLRSEARAVLAKVAEDAK